MTAHLEAASPGSSAAEATPAADIPAPEESPAEKDKRGRAALSQLLAPVSGRLLIGRILGALAGIVAVAPYVALVELGRAVLPALTGAPIDTGHVNTIIFWILASVSLQTTLTFVALLITHFADLRLSVILRQRIIERIARAPLSWFGENTSGQVRKAVQDDTKALHTLVAHAPVEQMLAVVTPLALAVYAFIIDWRLGLLAIASIPVYLAIQAFTMRGMGAKTAAMDTKLGHVASAIVEFCDGIGVVKAFGRTGAAHERYRRAADEFGLFYMAWVGPLIRIAAISEAVISVPVLVLLNVGVGSLLVTSGAVTAADVIATAMIALVLPATIQTLGTTAWNYQTAGAAALRLSALLATDELETVRRNAESGTPVAAAAAPEAPGTVRFDGVSFSYGSADDAPLALDDVSLTLEPGTVTALIGRSGSGKSTLALMLARFYDPAAGTIRIGGADIRSLPPSELYRRVSFVLQDPQLIAETIRENVRLAVPDAGDAAIWNALEQAQIAAEIRALPKGLDTVIGRDTELSGGQQQRIAIARALLADAPILILDEAMSATDPDSEAEIQQALTGLVAGRTVLVIAHRPESVLGADQIIRLDRGRIAERLTGSAITDDTVYTLMASGGTR